MNLSRTNIVLAVLLVAVVLLAAAVRVDHSQPNVEFLPEMKRSPAAGAYSASTVFPNGRTLQPPVAGTIARGELPLYYSATKEDAERAGEEILNPYTVESPVSTEETDTTENEQPGGEPNVSDQPSVPDHVQRLQASVQRGAGVYNVSCVSCHGPSGAGDGPVAKRGFPPPPPLTTGKSAQMKDGQLFHILTYGQGSMAPMAAQLSRDRRWDVINYVRSLQQGAAESTPPLADAPTEPPVATLEPSIEPSATEEGAP
ncbi:MAG: cytochrome c [Planctomycetaceae bacterium]|nr:cytochrome c [Planctomycetaceae bacterium]